MDDRTSSLSARRFARDAAFIYAVAAALWLYLSNLVIYRLLSYGEARERVSLSAILLFVGVTALVGYRLLRVHDRRQAETHGFLREILGRIDDGFIALDRDGRCTYANPRAASMLGHAGVDGVLGKTVWDVGLDFSGHALRQASERALDTQRPAVVENAVDEHGRWVESRIYPSANGLSIYLADITERKEAERSLAEAEAYRRNVFEQLGDGVLLIDRDQRFTDANARALAMLGYAYDELLATTAAQVLPGFERDHLGKEIDAIMDGRLYFDRWVLRRKDGGTFPVEVSARVLDERRYVAVVRDITWRLQNEEALRIYRDELSALTQKLLAQERMTLQRIAQALHDHVGQTLGAARLNLDAFLALSGGQDTAPQAHAERAGLLLAQAVTEVRQVLSDLRPPLLERQGLAAALAIEIESTVVTSRRVDVLLEPDDGVSTLRWPADVEYGAFMIAREAIANAQQHAEASLVRVSLGGCANALSLQVIDDGRGIPAPMIHGRPGHLGIVGMRERALAVGAQFELAHVAGGGTCVSMQWNEAWA